MKLKLEIDLPDTLDLIPTVESYLDQAHKMAELINEQVAKQYLADKTRKMDTRFIKDMLLLGMTFSATGGAYEASCADFFQTLKS